MQSLVGSIFKKGDTIMAEKKFLESLKSSAQKAASSIDVGALKEKTIEAAEVIKTKAVEAKDAAVCAKEDIVDKLT